MTHTHHHSRAWAPLPPTLPEWTIDDHTHVVSVVSYSREQAEEAAARQMPTVSVYSASELVNLADYVGVRQIVDVGCTLPELQPAIDFARAHPGRVFAGLAIHPTEAVLHGHHGAPGPDGLPVVYEKWHNMPFHEALDRVAHLAKNNPGIVVTIGETGLDYFRTGEAARGLQRQAFRDHIELARELDLPVQIHDRDADADVVSILLRDGAPPAGTVFHSFAADAETARIAREHGWYLSFSGTVTFPSNQRLREALHVIDIDHVLVETDAPYLTPAPWRGRTNAPQMVPYTLQAMAQELGMPISELARKTRANAQRLYHLPDPPEPDKVTDPSANQPVDQSAGHFVKQPTS